MSRLVRDDIDKFYDYGIHPSTRTIYVGSLSDEDGEESGTDYKMADHAIKGLHILDSAGDSPITVVMNNCGGEPIHGMAIFDAIRACSSKVTIRVLGSAMSMGSVILQAGDERVLTPNARVMIHYGTVGVGDHSKIAAAWIEEDKKFNKFMEDLFLAKIQAKHPTFGRAKLQKMLNFDTILDASQAVALGLADRIEETV